MLPDINRNGADQWPSLAAVSDPAQLRTVRSNATVPVARRGVAHPDTVFSAEVCDTGHQLARSLTSVAAVLGRRTQLTQRGRNEMVETVGSTPIAELPLAPLNPLPYRQKLKALREFHSGLQVLRDAGGPVTRLVLAPATVMAPVVVATKPQGARDILSLSGEFIERTRVHDEVRYLLGPNLLDLNHEPWIPRRRAIQPVFTKHNVRSFAIHMAEAAETAASSWLDRDTLDLDFECRTLSLRALGRSVLGIDLEGHTDTIGDPLRTAMEYAADRALRPMRAPAWLPTRARCRARAANRTLHGFAEEILRRCRADATRDAPLVQALIGAVDPATGRALSDEEICDELIVFLLAGHDTIATTLAYALWQLARHRQVQAAVRTEALKLGTRKLTPEDVPHLRYAAQVLYEAMRLCPPAAAITRTAVRDFAVDGYRVEAGTMVAVGVYAIHRDPELWDDPLAFRPERFAAEQSRGRDRWSYLPFGGGPRSCIGDHFAMLEMTLALATIMRRSHIDTTQDDFPITVPFTTVAAKPIYAQASPPPTPRDR